MWFIDKCKCCLKDGDMKDLWSEYVTDGEVEIYGDMLASCFALPYNERAEYMEKICESCVERLRTANEFRQEVVKSRQVLEKWAEDNRSQMKQEIVYESGHEDECEASGVASEEELVYLDDSSVVSQEDDMQVEYLEEDSEAKAYKVVKIIERGRAMLTAVPATWERKSRLRIPLKDRVEKIKRHATPEEDWVTIKCFVKKKVRTLEDARKEIRSIVARTGGKSDERDPLKLNDTNIEDPKNLPKTNEEIQFLCSRVPGENVSDHNGTRNFSNFDVTSGNPAKKIEVLASTIDDSEAMTPNFRTGDSQIPKLTHPTPDQNLDLVSKVDIITAQLSTVIENQKTLSMNQENMTYNMLKHSVMLEKLIERFSPRQENYDEEMDFKPISNEEEFQRFEEQIKNPSFKADLMKKFSVLCSKGEGKGVNNAYKLIDVFFTRDFMSQCSWAGGSRGEDRKVCFKIYQNTIMFFYAAVKATDDTYTLDNCELFFKNLLKNAKKRSLQLNVRTSTGRLRKKKIKMRLKTDDEGDESM